MNHYIKYCPNVFVVACQDQHEKGATVEVTTRYGDTHEVIIFNHLGNHKDGRFVYSCIRADGFNYREYCIKKAARREAWAISATKKSNSLWEASSEGSEFLSLAEPIKIGHHSERRHRALIERNHNRMRRSVEQQNKAEDHMSKADYWKSKSEIINLSMPESVEYFEHELEQAKKEHSDLKSGRTEKQHSYSMVYAKKRVNELQKKYDLALKLWGEN